MRSVESAVGEALVALDPVLDLAVDRSLASTADQALLTIDVLEHVTTVLRLKHLAAHHLEGMSVRAGCRSTAGRFAAKTGRRHSTVAGDVALAVRLFNGGDLARTGDELTSGRISVGRARAIHTGTTGLLAKDVVTLQDILLECRALTPEDMGLVCARARRRLEDESAAQERYERQLASRGLDLTDAGDMLLLRGRLTPEQGRRLMAWLTVAAAPRPGPDGERDPRSATQRRVDALDEVIGAALGATRGRSRPATEGAEGAGDAGDAGDADDEATEDTAAGATVGHARTTVLLTLTPADVERLQHPTTTEDHALRRRTCDAELTWALIDELPDQPAREPDPPPGLPPDFPRAVTPLSAPEGAPLTPANQALLRHALSAVAPAFGGIRLAVLNHGRKRRLATDPMRSALAIRDGGCVFTSCPAPPWMCEAHHRRHWADDGPTDLDELALVCEFHHHLIHEGGWTLMHHPLDGWVAIPPARYAAAA